MTKKLGIFLLISISLSSCASLLNNKKTVVKISSDTESKIIFNKDTLFTNQKKSTIRPLRLKETIKISVLKDSLKQDFYLKPKLSSILWLNAYAFGLGVFIDLSSNKRFTYKHNLHFVTDSVSKKIVISHKKVALLPKNKFFLFTTPLLAFDFFSIPILSLGSEYFVKDNISLSAEYGVKFYSINYQKPKVSYLKDKATTYRLETKWYNGINLTKNVHINEYIALEFREIRSQYNDNFIYFERNNSSQNNYTTDYFATKKTTTILNLKYGLLIPIGNRFYFDFYSGFGIRIKRFNHTNLEFDKTIHQIYVEDSLFPSFPLRGFEDYLKKTLLNYTLGFKFGIKL
jgi:hypothetical protein